MKLLRSIVSLGFAFLVLVSTTQFMVGIHHCGDQVRHVALFDKAEACAMEKQLPACHRIETVSCCQDVTVIHEDEDFSVDWNPVEWSVLGSDAVNHTSLILSEVIPSSVSLYPQYYSPPLRSFDRTVTLQVFLI
ncbi:MAG: hypothetical protein JNN04_16100 [Cyclobacteriaceae bacterium]|nr:hypothetical protein [Cyclobacteriaceae bacterium]